MPIINKSISIYQVGIYSNSKMRIPQLCTCCLAPTDKSERIHFVNTKRGLLSRSKTYTFLDLPLCPVCKQHRNEQRCKKYLSLTLSICLGFVVFLLLRAQAVNIYLGIWMFAAFSLALFFLCDNYWPLSKLDKTHATYGPSAAFGHFDEQHGLAVLNFANKEYVKQLCNSNNWEYSKALTKSEMRNYIFIIIVSCLILGLMLQDLYKYF